MFGQVKQKFEETKLCTRRISQMPPKYTKIISGHIEYIFSVSPILMIFDFDFRDLFKYSVFYKGARGHIRMCIHFILSRPGFETRLALFKLIQITCFNFEVSNF